MQQLEKQLYERTCVSFFNALVWHYGQIKDSIGHVSVSWFAEKSKQDIFEVIKALGEKHDVIEKIDIVRYLERIDGWTAAHRSFLLDIGDDKFRHFRIKDDLEFLASYSRKARLKKHLQQVVSDFNDGKFANLEDSTRAFQEKLNKEKEAATDETGGITSIDIALDDLETARVEAKTNPEERLLTGFNQLDELVYLYRPSSLATIAARASVGKTTFCINLIYNALRTFEKRGDKESTVGIISLETRNVDTLINLLALKSRYDLSEVRDYYEGRAVDKETQDVLNEERLKLKNDKLLLNDDCALYLEDISDWITKCATKHKLKFVVIDHIQLVKSRQYTKEQNLNLLVGHAARVFKQLALKLNICIIAISQLNRRIENRSKNDKEPEFADLRDSGGIEQDSDVVIFLTPQKEEGDGEEKKLSAMTNFWIKKNRWGPIGEFALYFARPKGRFGLQKAGKY